jgi:ubiquitin carboxyl-terminal hydrolase 9/13
MCDDENIEPIDDADIYRYFGDYPSGAGYVLFYQAVDLDLPSLGLKVPPKAPEEPTSEPAPAAMTTSAAITVTPDVVTAPRADLVETAGPPSPDSVPANPTPALPPTPAPVLSPKPSAPIEFIQPRRTTSTVSAISAPSVASPPVVRAPPIVQPPIQAPTTVPPPTVNYPSRASSPPTPSPVSAATKEDKWYRRKSTTTREGPTPAENTASTPLAPPTLGRQPSSRDRTVSNSSQASNTTPNTSDKYSGGGGLSRRLSGMSVGKIGRSGSMSFGKLGFGKKDKNGIAE